MTNIEDLITAVSKTSNASVIQGVVEEVKSELKTENSSAAVVVVSTGSSSTETDVKMKHEMEPESLVVIQEVTALDSLTNLRLDRPGDVIDDDEEDLGPPVEELLPEGVEMVHEEIIPEVQDEPLIYKAANEVWFSDGVDDRHPDFFLKSETHMFGVHRDILFNSCPGLEKGIGDDTGNVLPFEGFLPEALEMCLRYIYRGEYFLQCSPGKFQIYLEMLKIAKIMECSGLVRFLEKIISYKVNDKNAEEAFMVATLYDSVALQKLTFKIVKKIHPELKNCTDMKAARKLIKEKQKKAQELAQKN